MEDVGIRFLVLGLGEFRRSVGTARDDITGLEGAIRRLSGTTKGVGTTLTTIGGAMVGLGRTLSLFLSVPLAATTGLLINAGVQFEDTFAGITKTVEGTAIGFDEIAKAAKTQLGITVTTMDDATRAADAMGIHFGDLTPIGEDLRAQFRQLALEIPVSADELNKLGEVVGQLGVQADQVANVTKMIAELGIVSDISGEEAAKSILKIGHILEGTGLNVEDFVQRAGSALVALGNQSVSTEGEILNLALRLAAAGERAKFSEPQLFAWATTLADVGSRAEAGGTAVSRAITEIVLAIQTGDSSLTTFAQVAGETADQFSKDFEQDASKALAHFIQKLEEGIKTGKVNKDMLAEMGLSGVRAIDILGRLGDAEGLLAKNQETSNTAWQEGIFLQEAAAKRFETVKSQIELLRNTFVDLGITLFDLVKGDMKDFINTLRDVIKWFKELSPQTQKTILIIAAIGAALGPVLIIFGALISSVGTLITALAALISSPIGLVALAIAGVGVALVSLLGWDATITAIGEAFQFMSEKVSGVLGLVESLAKQKINLEDIMAALHGKVEAPKFVATPGVEAPPPVKGEAHRPVEQAPAPAQTKGEAHRPIDTSSLTVANQDVIDMQNNLAKLGFPPEFVKVLDSIILGFSQFKQTIADVGAGFSAGFAPFLEGAGPQIALLFERVKEAVAPLGPVFDSMGVSLNGIDWKTVGEVLGKIAGLVFANIIDFLTVAADLIGVVIAGVQGLSTVVSDVLPVLDALFIERTGNMDLFTQRWQQLVADVDTALTNLKTVVGNLLTDIVNTSIATFQRLYDAIVGHSIIIDLKDDILVALTELKDLALGIFTALAGGVTSTLAGIFSGKQGGDVGIGLTVTPEQIATITASIEEIKTSWSTFMLSVTTDLNAFMLSVQTQFLLLPGINQLALDAMLLGWFTFTLSLTNQLLLLQAVVGQLFTNMGTVSTTGFTAAVLASMASLVMSMTGQFLILDLYWLETIKHMVGHWLDFVAAANSLTSEFVNTTIHEFDRLHNDTVGRIHSLSATISVEFETLGGNTGATLRLMGGSFNTFAIAAEGAADRAKTAFDGVCDAVQKAQACITGSPELVIQHPFEKFEKYLGRTDFGGILDKSLAMPSISTAVSFAPPMSAVGGTSIDRSVSTGDIVGAPFNTADDVVETLLRVIRLGEAVS